MVRIFQGEQSVLRLIGAVLFDVHEEWQSRVRYTIKFIEKQKSGSFK